MLYYCFTTAFTTTDFLLLISCCFTTALLLLYYCFCLYMHTLTPFSPRRQTPFVCIYKQSSSKGVVKQ
jgi:hypothetical protein